MNRGSGKASGFILLYMALLMAGACKKADVAEPSVPQSSSRSALTKDSIYLYAKQIYLWNDALPSYEAFNPRKYSTYGTDLDNYNAELFDITQIKINPLTSKPYEYTGNTGSAKYSYIFNSDNKNPSAFVPAASSSIDLEGNGNDFGLKVSLYGSSNSYKVYVQAVFPGSPAQKAGLTRGCVLENFNGQTVGSNGTAEVPVINTALFSSSIINLGGKRIDGTSFTNLTLNKSAYTSSPVLKDTILTEGSKKIGYLLLARFSSGANAEGVLSDVFSKFAGAGANNLVIDLRYNGGGYVSTAQYLINLIAPSSLNGKVMFEEHYNSLMKSGKATILTNQPLLNISNKVQFQNGKMLTYADVDYSVAGNTNTFSKRGSLEGISNVVFIVSGNTASASELVINSLKPYLNVKLVGTTTYGKPVGFFPVRIENKYDVYFSMFQTRNSAGQGEYFAGFTPDAVDSFDDAQHNFGDRAENYLSKSIAYIVTNTFTATTAKTITINSERVSASSVNIDNLGEEREFKGMIENRLKLK